jgi:hypothetical protein
MNDIFRKGKMKESKRKEEISKITNQRTQRKKESHIFTYKKIPSRATS